MPHQRFLLQILIFLMIALAGYVVLFAAEAACASAWLPGDTLWTLRHLAQETFARLFGAQGTGAVYCAGSPLTGAVRDLAPWLLPALGGVLAMQGLYEWKRHAMLRAWLVRRGGHALLLGDGADLAALTGPMRRAGGVLLVGRDGHTLDDLRRGFWRLPSCAADGRPEVFGPARARAVLAVSRSDIANLNFVERLRMPQSALPPVTLRIENAAIRAAQRAGGAGIEEISINQAMFREGARRGDPGRLFAEGVYPAHIVLIGAGPRLGELALHLAAFGYGLERAVPRFTVISTAGSAAPSVAGRLRAADDVLDLRLLAIDRADTVALEHALAAILAGGDGIAAIHCIDESPGEALAGALVAAATATTLQTALMPVVIAYGRAGEDVPDAAVAAGVEVIGAEDLATAIAEKDRRDRMARAVHAAYLAHQQAHAGTEVGKEFGKAPAEKPWSALPMAFRDDNRAVADHIDHMLKASGLARRAATGTPVILDADRIEAMAAMAHARWVAGKRLDGWRCGVERSDLLRLHPGLVAYGALPEAEKEKDRQQIRAIPHILAILGEEIGPGHPAGAAPAAARRER